MLIDFNLANYIEKNSTLSNKDIYERLTTLHLIDYSYNNFLKKLRNDTFSAKELIGLNLILDINIDYISKLVEKKITSSFEIAAIKNNYKMSNFQLQSFLSKIGKRDISRSKINYYSEYKDNNLFSIIWVNEVVYLVESDTTYNYGIVRMVLSNLNDLLDVGQLNINELKNPPNQQILKILFDYILDQYQALSELELLDDDSQLHFYSSELSDRHIFDIFTNGFSEELGDYKQIYSSLSHMKVMREFREKSFYAGPGVSFAPLVLYLKEGELSDDDNQVSIKGIVLENENKNEPGIYYKFISIPLKTIKKQNIYDDYKAGKAIEFNLDWNIETIEKLNLLNYEPETIVACFKEFLD